MIFNQELAHFFLLIPIRIILGIVFAHSGQKNAASLAMTNTKWAKLNFYN
jgi:hypothetical protein